MKNFLIFLTIILLSFWFGTTTYACLGGTLGCKTCSSTTACSECLPGFQKTAGNECEKCLAGCDYCTTATDCLMASAAKWIQKGGHAGQAATLASKTKTNCDRSHHLYGDDATTTGTIEDNTEFCLIPTIGYSEATSAETTLTPLTSAVTNCAFARGAKCAKPAAGKASLDFFKPCPAGCTFCDSTVTDCTGCSDTAKRPDDTGACVAMPNGNTYWANCEVYDTTNSKCTTCKLGYGGDACESCTDANVVDSTTPASNCVYCAPAGFFYEARRNVRQLVSVIVSGKCQPFTTGTPVVTAPGADNCEFYMVKGTTLRCVYCSAGYGPAEVATDDETNSVVPADCTACHPGCDSCVKDNSNMDGCTVAADGYYLVRINGKTGIVGSCFHEDCVTCIGPYIYDCTAWIGFYVAAQPTAASLVDLAATTGCALLNKATGGNKCLYAESGYVVKSDGSVATCFKDCAVCSVRAGTDALANECTTAADGFWINKAAATWVIAACGANCKTCTSLTVCTECNAGFGVTTTNTCSNQCIANCASCFAATFAGCDTCDTDYEKNSTASTCQKKSTTTNPNNTNNTNGTTFGFLLSAIASMISLILILMI